MNSVLLVGYHSALGAEVLASLQGAEQTGSLKVMCIGQEEALSHPEGYRKQAMENDLVILCGQGFNAQKLYEPIKDHRAVIDASPQFRFDPQWAYAIAPFESLGAKFSAQGAQKRFSNAGCIATAATLCLRPIRDLFSNHMLIQANVLVGTSVGGSKFSLAAPEIAEKGPLFLGLSSLHRHTEEIKRNSKLRSELLLQVMMGSNKRGICVQLTVQENADKLYKRYEKQYKGTHVKIDLNENKSAHSGMHQELEGAQIVVCPITKELSYVLCALDNLKEGGADPLVRAMWLMLN